MFKKIQTILIVLTCLSVNGEFADDFKPCKYGDTECIKAIIGYIFKEKLQGYDSINLYQLYPLKYEKVRLQQGAESPVSLEVILKNQSLYGLETAKVLKVKGFGKDLTKRHIVKLHTDYLTTVGDYDINGKILILPIMGSGTLNITFVDVIISFSFVGKPLEKNGAIYMDIEHLSLNCELKKLIFKLDNLFNGDKALGDNMNLFLNDNWQDVYNEVRTSFNEGFGDIGKNIIKDVFSKYPYDKYFTD